MKIVIVRDEHHQCPHCGEGYFYRDWWTRHEETIVEICDGEEGCGKKYKIRFDVPRGDRE